MKKGLIYCQHLIGIGHLKAMLNASESLVHKFKIDFLQGGPDIHQTVHSPHFRHLLLPPLFLLKRQSDVIDPTGKHTVPEVFAQRKEMIDSDLKGPYDFFITEYFPFSKLFFADEIIYIIEKIKKENPKCLIISLCKDMTPRLSHQQQLEVVDIINKCYDHVFVRSDPSILRLEETFPAAVFFEDRLSYIGFLTKPGDLPKATQRKNQILVSNGGGAFGEELLKAVANVAHEFPNYTFLFALGPHTPPSIIRELESMHLSNVKMGGFLEDFKQELSMSALSISLAGATIFEVCETRTPAIAYAFDKSATQYGKASIFAKKGLVQLATAQDLHPSRLAKLIQKALKAPYPKVSLNFHGADNLTKALQKML